MKTLMNNRFIAIVLAFAVSFAYTSCELDDIQPDEVDNGIFDPESIEYRFLGTWERAPELGDDEWDPMPEGEYVRWIFNNDGTAVYESRLTPWGEDEAEEITKNFDSFKIEGDALILSYQGNTEQHRVTISNTGTQGLLYVGYDYLGTTFSPVPYLYQGEYTLGDYFVEPDGDGGDGGDDDNGMGDFNFAYGDIFYYLPFATLEIWDQCDNGNIQMDFYLWGDDYQENILFGLYFVTETEHYLSAGEYDFAVDCSDFTIYGGLFRDDSLGIFAVIENAHAVVKRNDVNYEIEIVMTCEDGVEVLAYYKGEIFIEIKNKSSRR